MPGQVRGVGQVLALLNRGKFREAVDRHLMEAVETLEALPSEKGTATIDIRLKIDFQGGLCNVTPSVKSKLPEEGFSPTPFWSLDGGLSVEHPNQADMFGPREIPREAAEA